MTIPRSEYPREQFKRDAWMNLNGTWQFEFDFGLSGLERKWFENGPFTREILVPFCPESTLSGIGYTDFFPAVWYRRTFTIDSAWLAQNTLLHFGAVDYACTVWINGKFAGRHEGGYSSFSFDISRLVTLGENTLVVYATDDVRSRKQPVGKQSQLYFSHDCDYTRTTGIWQTVWLERVPLSHITKLKIYPDVKNQCAHLHMGVKCASGATLTARAYYDGQPMGEVSCTADANNMLTLPLAQAHLWEIGKGRLYQLEIELSENGAQQDCVHSYFGLRSLDWQGNCMRINGKNVFQRLILDQGFYPGGIYTAPSDDALKNDILLAMRAGFNGARLHQKMFEERFLYHADALGYIVWGEHASWGMQEFIDNLPAFLSEWCETLQRDFNHPSIVGWCPFNETTAMQDERLLKTVYQQTKALDPTRPVIDASGWQHVISDIYDVHTYEQDPEKFNALFEPFIKEDGQPYRSRPEKERYEGQPYFVSEFGGTYWNPNEPAQAWGYGARPRTLEEFISRFEQLCLSLLNNPNICAYCYTQLTDVEQECNGLYFYERTDKFPPQIYARIRAINATIAAIEKQD